jgi:hypothetical protein
MVEREPLAPDARLRLWAEALVHLAEPEQSKLLIEALNQGDRRQLEAVLEPTRIFEFGACIDVVRVLTAVVNFGPGHWENRCEVVWKPPQINPSQVNGKYYVFPDGRVTFVSDADWWEYYKRAQNDPDYLAQNKDLLTALGIITCTKVFVSNEKLVQDERTRTICFPTVTDPYA